jgi:hypothetical protein
LQLGKNDLPAAGKIDPWDNREVANKQYQERVSSEENINERREKAFAQKDKIFARLEKDIANKEWKSASDYLNVQMLDLRRAMNMVSTKVSVKPLEGCLHTLSCCITRVSGQMVWREILKLSRVRVRGR